MLALDFSILVDHLDMYLEGFIGTIRISLLTLVGSFLLGTFIAVMRIAPLKPLNWLGTAMVEFDRYIPF